MRGSESGSLRAVARRPGDARVGRRPDHLAGAARLLDQGELLAWPERLAVVAAREHGPDVRVVAVLAVPEEAVGLARVAGDEHLRARPAAVPDRGLLGDEPHARRAGLVERVEVRRGVRRASRAGSRSRGRPGGSRTRRRARRARHRRSGCGCLRAGSRSGSAASRTETGFCLTMLFAASSHHFDDAAYPAVVRGSPNPQPAGEIRYEARKEKSFSVRGRAGGVRAEVVELVDLAHVRLGHDVEGGEEVAVRGAGRGQAHVEDPDRDRDGRRLPVGRDVDDRPVAAGLASGGTATWR